MRKIFYIKIFSIIGFGFLVLGNISLGQQIDLNTNNSNTSRYNNERTNNQNTNNSQYGPKIYQTADESQNTPDAWCRGGKIIGGNFCECPDGTKNINGACESCAKPDVCCGIQLNTKVPFIGNCIEFTKKCKETEPKCPNDLYQCIDGKCRVVKNDPNQTVVDEEEAFPNLMGGLIKMLVTIIMLGSFIAILAGGVMISAAGPDEQKAAKGKKLIINVVVALAILGASGVILRLINPNFFG